jgi:3-deoxy-7-phosphoheptulonate synthase
VALSEDWRALPAAQQPVWPDQADVTKVRSLLTALPPLVPIATIRALSAQLARVPSGGAFVVQAGDCAEPFGAAAVAGAQNKIRVIHQLSALLEQALGVPVLRIGRLAGQFAKPRSASVEVIGSRALWPFRGLIINSPAATEQARRPDPLRMIDGYNTARLVFGELADEAARAALEGITDPVWASHEALLLDYEEPQVRSDPGTGQRYLLSTHLPWIGERTRQLDGAHVAFLGAMANPVACKLGPGTTPEDLLGLCAKLNPDRLPGRLTLISRMGAGLVEDRLPALVRAVASAGHPVIWMCDPMHGNQVHTASGRKTRRITDVVDELRAFTEILRDRGEWPGGIHLEIAGEDVTECLWGDDLTADEELDRAYRSLCDGRLNNAQASYVVDQMSAFLTEGRARQHAYTAYR